MKLSFRKRFAPDGTVYRQAISMKYDEFHKLQDCFNVEIILKLPRKKEYIYNSGHETFMQMIVLEPTKQICFMNLTQTRFLNLFLKLPLKDYNTCIIIKD